MDKQEQLFPMDNTAYLYSKAIALLEQLIATPSFSKEEDATASVIEQWFQDNNVTCNRIKNNVFARNLYHDDSKPTLLLNSHHDTVKPATGYTKDPFCPVMQEGKLYGLGSNDAGGPLVALMSTFLHFYPEKDLPFNLTMAATAEEEISGANGISVLLEHLGTIEAAIVGEPTLMQMAVAERGLLVVDAVATGISGHAARNEGVNAIYNALKDIAWIQQYQFEKTSEFLDKVSMNVTAIQTTNKAHNVVPDNCTFTVDIRLNELYTHEEILATLRKNLQSTITPRSTRLRSSMIESSHPLVIAGKKLGMTAYGSPTLSDKALMPFPALKLGPGDSARSHSADEFIYPDEINNGIRQYIALINETVRTNISL
jgi:acetylornithine deacetylase